MLLCTMLSLNNANGFFKRNKKSQNFRLGKEFSVFLYLCLGYVRVSGRKLKTQTGCFNSEGLTEVGERKAESLRCGKVIQPRRF